MMIRLAITLTSIAINGATIPPAIAQCMSAQEATAMRTRSDTLRSRLEPIASHDAACRAFAATFYELVTMRQAAASCAREAERDLHIVALDSEIDTYNDLIASRCGG